MGCGAAGVVQKNGCVLTPVNCENARLDVPNTCYVAMGLNPRAN